MTIAAVLLLGIIGVSSASADELVSVTKVNIGGEEISLPSVIKSKTGDMCVSFISKVVFDHETNKYTHETNEYCGAVVIRNGEKHPSGLVSMEWVQGEDKKAGIHILTIDLKDK